jgi:hypothetical protein
MEVADTDARELEKHAWPECIRRDAYVHERVLVKHDEARRNGGSQCIIYTVIDIT